MKDINLKKIEKDILGISIDAGKLLLKFQKRLDLVGVVSKELAGIASNADVASEKLIISKLNKLYPNIPVLSEEKYYRDFKNNPSFYKEYEKEKYIWVIDPLDGTNNFVHGLDYFAVCISLVKNGKPIVGVVHAPLRKETFIATHGQGARLIRNKTTKILTKISGRKNLSECLVSTGFIKIPNEDMNTRVIRYTKILNEVRAIRRMGSAALDLCYTAANIYDAFWERGLAPWDMAAPFVICAEVGVKITKINGDKHSIFVPDILAARPPIHKILKEKLA